MNWLAVAKLWLAVRPIHRLRERRRRKRLEQSSELIETEEEDSDMNDWQQSLLRSLLKVIGTAAVTHGLIEAGQTDVLVTALEAIAGGVITCAGLWLSHRKHKA